jgi:6-phosphogluconolactonase
VKGHVVRCALGVVAAVALMSLTGGDLKARQAPVAPRVEGRTTRVYVGTYTRGASRGIYVVGFDPSSGTWTSAPALAGQSENPSFLALHPSGRFLYAVNEVADFKGARTGAVSAFAVDQATGHLTLVNQQPSEGANPCHITIDSAGRNALVANYTSGTVAVLPIARDGGLGPASAVRRRSGSGPVRARQEGPHAHQIVLDASGRFAIWTDLGTDRVLVDRYTAGAGTLEPNEPDGVGIQPGSGPRHLAWHPAGRVLYLLNELSSTVSALRFDASRAALEVFQTVPARSAGASGQNTAAEIAVSLDGRFLYTSNRGDDDIAVFAIDGASGGLTPVAHVPTGGRTPRSFAIDPSGRWLVVANQGSSSIVVFRLDSATGVPARAGPSASVPEPVCVLFAPSAGTEAGAGRRG